MPSSSTAIISLAIAAGLAGVLADASSSNVGPEGPQFALPALSWAQSHCGAKLVAAPGTPRIQADDFMRVAAEYDARRAADGLAATCARAMAAARPITLQR